MADITQKRILVVDDERDVCEILKVKLQKQGFHVDIAYDGTHALARAIVYRPHCILLDIRMSPGDDGLTFLRKLRSFRDDNDLDLEDMIRKTPVIIMTAASGKNMQSLFELEGISGFLEKPYDSEVLKDLIIKVTG